MNNQALILFITFTIATLSLWMPRLITAGVLLIAISIGFSFDAFSRAAVLWIVLFAMMCWMFAISKGRRRYLSAAGLILLALALGLHLLPGFTPMTLVEPVTLSARATPFSLALSLDKIFAGILMTAIIWRRLIVRRGDLVEAMSTSWPLIAANIVVLTALSVLVGFTQFDPKFSWLFFVWAIHNLLFTCLSEEMFFRGFVQWELMHSLRNHVRGKWIALLISAIAFGAVHLSGGWLYALISCIAGAGYGYVFMRTMRLEMAMLAHFSVNAVHFLLFAYPRVA